MNINELKKLSREELFEFIENLNKHYDLDTTGIDVRLADFRTMVESAYDIIFTIDKDRRIQYTRRIGHDNAMFARGGQRHTVITDAEVGDHLQRRQPRDEGGVGLRVATHQQAADGGAE